MPEANVHMLLPYSIRDNKILAIKSLRDFCEIHFGARPDLLASKNFIDALQEASHFQTVVSKVLAETSSEYLQRELKRRGYKVQG
jgi:hypothetical protein